MDTTEPGPTKVIPRPRGWPLFLAGVLLCFVGPAAYAVQFNLKHLSTPWYMPMLATAGVVLMVASIWRRWGIVRLVLLVPLALLCGLEWFALGVAFRNPTYAGPAQPGRTVPAFKASLADGTPFTENDLKQGKATVLLFYRGHW